MKIKSKLSFIILLMISCLCVQLKATAQADEINAMLDEFEIKPTTISFHPDGDILIATPYSRDTDSQYLLLITKEKDQFSIDTLENSRPNRAAFSTNGEYMIYNYRDKVSERFHTVKRKYNDKDDIGYPIFLTGLLSEDNMYYYSMTANQDFYYYTYNYDDSTRRGIYYSKFANGNYHPQELVVRDRANAVAYSPLLLNDSTMLMAQHGKIDDSEEGIHFSLKNSSGWSKPVRLAGIPMSNVITYFDKDHVAFLKAEDQRIQLISIEELMTMIKKQ